MRAMRFGLAAIAVISTVAPLTLCAQSEAVCTPGVFSSTMISISSVSGKQPSRVFTVRFKGTFDQRLPDGSSIHGESHVTGARDSSGRTHNEFMMQCFRGEDGKAHPVIQVTVNDPKELSNLRWQVGNMIGQVGDYRATLIRMTPVPVVPPAPKQKLTPEEVLARKKATEARQPQYKREDLGTRSIAGFQAHGTRFTRTIPPGEEGNELQLVVVNENWHSDELGLEMMTVYDDPRRGRTVAEVEEVVTSEPSAALFTPPAGYKIVEVKPQVEVPVTSTNPTQ